MTSCSVAVSPVAFALLHILRNRKCKKDPCRVMVQNFVSVFLIHLMYLQSYVKRLVAFIDENKSAYIESRVLNFICFWSRDDSANGSDCPAYPSDTAKIISSLYSCLLESGSVDEVRYELYKLLSWL